jgi:hypothetical protein
MQTKKCKGEQLMVHEMEASIAAMLTKLGMLEAVTAGHCIKHNATDQLCYFDNLADNRRDLSISP